MLKNPITSVCVTIWMDLNLFNFDRFNFKLSPDLSSGENCWVPGSSCYLLQSNHASHYSERVIYYVTLIVKLLWKIKHDFRMTSSDLASQQLANGLLLSIMDVLIIITSWSMFNVLTVNVYRHSVIDEGTTCLWHAPEDGELYREILASTIKSFSCSL